MPTWSDPALTLQRALEALGAGWLGLSPAGRDELGRLLRTYGPQIAADRITTLSRINFLLGELWDRRAALPPSAVAALGSGQGASAVRGGGALAPAARERLLGALLALVDFRVYAGAPAPAERLVSLVAGHLDRLSEAERAGWASLTRAYARDHDAVRFLDAAGDRLSAYPPVRSLLESGKVLAPPPTAAVRRGLPTARPAQPDGLSLAEP